MSREEYLRTSRIHRIVPPGSSMMKKKQESIKFVDEEAYGRGPCNKNKGQ
jgi:hypothetical protein